MNQNGFYALYFSGGGYAAIPWNVPVPAFTLCVRFLVDDINFIGTLFNLGTNLSVEIVNGQISVTANQRHERSETVVLTKCWNTVSAVYHGEMIFLYHNMELCFTYKATLPCTGLDKLELGKDFKGCIQNIKIYHHGMTQDEIRLALLSNNTEAEQQFLFNSSSLPENVTLHECRLEDLVYTFDSRGGVLAAEPVTLTPEWSILLTCYPLQNRFSEENVSLFTLPGIKIKLIDEDGENRFDLQVQCGNDTYEPNCSLDMNCWADIAMIYKGKKLFIYLDGQQNAEIDLGNFNPQAEGNIEFGQFTGYIDSCALFGRALNPEEVHHYIQSPPFVFDPEIIRLYRFSDTLSREWCKGGKLTKSGDAHMALVAGTHAKTSPSGGPGWNGPKEKHEYSEFAKWQIYTLLRLLVEWIAAWVGVYPNRGVHMVNDKLVVEEELFSFVYREIVCLPEAQKLLSHYDEPKPDELLDLIRKMEQTGALMKLLSYLYQKDDDQEPVYPLLLPLLLAALSAAGSALANSLGSALAAALAGLISKPPNHTDDNHDDDDDEKKKKTYFSLRQVFLKGDIKVNKKETTAQDDSSQAAVYVINGQSNAKLSVKVACSGEGGQFTISAESKSTGLLKKVEKQESFTSGQTVEIEFDVQLNKDNKHYGQLEEALHWTIEAKDNSQFRFLGDTEHEIHLLENSPCEPWSSSGIDSECLYLSAECAKAYAGNSKGFVIDYAQWLSQNEQMESTSVSAGASRKSYSRMPQSKTPAAFDARNFARDYRRMNRKGIDKNDLAISHAILSRMHGHNMSTAFISPCMDCRRQKEDGSLVYGNSRLLPKDFNRDLTHCHVVTIDQEDNIYDSEFGCHGIPFSTDPELPFTGEENAGFYREAYFSPGSYCEILFCLNKWQLEEIDPEPSNLSDPVHSMPEVGAIVYINRQYEHNGREFTDRYIRSLFQCGPGQAVCHSISYHDIECSLAAILNSYNQNHNLADFESQIGHLLEAVCPEYVTNNPAVNNAIRSYRRGAQRLALTLSRLIQQNRHPYLLDCIDHFRRLLTNSPGNLRVGDGSWNRKVSSAFDVTNWFYLNNEGRVSASVNAIDRVAEPLVPGRHYPLGVPEPVNEGFYLSDPIDGVRILEMQEAVGPYLILPIYIHYDNPHQPAEDTHPLIISSSNLFGLRDTTDYLLFERRPLYILERGNNLVYHWLRLYLQ